MYFIVDVKLWSTYFMTQKFFLFCKFLSWDKNINMEIIFTSSLYVSLDEVSRFLFKYANTHIFQSLRKDKALFIWKHSPCVSTLSVITCYAIIYNMKIKVSKLRQHSLANFSTMRVDVTHNFKACVFGQKL